MNQQDPIERMPCELEGGLVLRWAAPADDEQLVDLYAEALFASGEIEVLTADVPWNVEAFALSPDGSRLALSINEDGYSRISVWQLPGHRPLALPEQPQGVLTGFHFSPDGNGLAFSLATPTSPASRGFSAGATWILPERRAFSCGSRRRTNAIDCRSVRV